jgi:hypothetical protein
MRDFLNAFIVMSISLFVQSANATAHPDEILSSYVFMSRGDDFEERVRTVVKNPRMASIDFTNIKIEDDDLDIVFEGLVERQKTMDETGERHKLQLLAFAGDITRFGFLVFLRNLQKGKKEGGTKIYPDVRESVIKVRSLTLSEEFGDEMMEVAPSVLAGRVRIVD